MSYEYQKEKPGIFEERNQKDFLQMRDKVFSLLKLSGAVRMEELMNGLTGSSWQIMAYVDRLVELGEIREIEQPNPCGQERIFVRV